MNINWTVIAIVLIGAILLIIWLVLDNLKDKKEVEKKLNTPTELPEDSDLEEDN